MKELQIINPASPQVLADISAKDFYLKLGLDETNFSKWVRRNIIGTVKKPTGLIEGIDYVKSINDNLKHNAIDYLITLDTAKHLCLMGKTEIGYEYRKHLIGAERALKTMIQGELAKMDDYKDMLALLEEKNKALRLEADNSNIEAVKLKDLFRVSNYRIGRNQLYVVLRNAGLLTRDNKPTSIAVKSGYLTMNNKDIFISREGLAYIMELITDKELQIMEAPTVEDILNILDTHNSLIAFNEAEHSYTVKGVKYPSVSTVLKKFTPDFPANFIANKVASKRNREEGVFYHSQSSILAEWDLKRDIAANYGTYIHYRLELYAKKYLNFDKVVNPSSINYSLITEEYSQKVELAVSRGIKWLDSMIAKGYQLIDTEVRMYNKIKGFTGTADLVFLKDGKLIIADWKSNLKDITSDGYNNYMNAPFNTLKATTLNKYKIQLNLYKALLEGILPLTVSQMLIIHITPEDCVSYDVEDYSDIIMNEL